jgi:ATP-dependent DNA ligase
VHGFAVLHLDGPLRDLPAEERTATLEVMLDHIARGLA